MKFSEYPYARPDIAALKQECSDLAAAHTFPSAGYRGTPRRPCRRRDLRKAPVLQDFIV